MFVNSERVQNVVCDALKIPRESLFVDSHAANFVKPRQIAMWLQRQQNPRIYSYPRIGEIFGGYHHSTVMYAVEKVEYWRQRDIPFQRFLDELQAKLKESTDGRDYKN